MIHELPPFRLTTPVRLRQDTLKLGNGKVVYIGYDLSGSKSNRYYQIDDTVNLIDHQYNNNRLNGKVKHLGTIKESIGYREIVWVEWPNKETCSYFYRQIEHTKRCKLWVRWGNREFCGSYFPEELELLQEETKKPETKIVELKPPQALPIKSPAQVISNSGYKVSIIEPITTVSHTTFVFDPNPNPDGLIGLLEKYDTKSGLFHSKALPHWQTPKLREDQL